MPGDDNATEHKDQLPPFTPPNSIGTKTICMNSLKASRVLYNLHSKGSMKSHQTESNVVLS